MPAWTDYTSKTTPADNDEVMIKDYSDSSKANKRLLFSGLWNWIVNKLTNAVIANLETSPQTIVGAINEVNGKFKVVSYNSETLNIPSNTGGYIQINSIIPSGYIPIGVTVANSSVPGGTVFVLASISKTANENFINYFNRHSETTLSTTLTFEVLCIKK